MSKNKYNLPDDHLFTYNQIIDILNEYMEKTLGEADVNDVFNKTIDHPKITGIAGDVVEQSILGYKPDNSQRPDILVDGIPYEVKTTGIKYSKSDGKYEAKEPMSITAVSPKDIVNEEFETSHFWEKLNNMLIVYYYYDSDVTVKAKDYANFYLKDYEFHKFDEKDKNILHSDWQIVRDFIKSLQNKYKNPELEYPRISSELRTQLMYIDTAPKWPNSPRFRLKRSVVTGIIRNHFENKLNELPDEYDSFKDFDAKLHEITAKYRGKTVEELINIFSIPVKDENRLNKAISEQIVIRMFGGKSKKINNIELFNKVGIIAKTLCLSSKGKRTEDMKLFAIDFNEWTDTNIDFEDSYLYEYFMNHQLLCILFEEKNDKHEFKNNRFLGFKRYSFSSDFIDNKVFKIWNDVRSLVNDNKLKEEKCYRKDGSLIINKAGTCKTKINFPKSSTNSVFVRGAGKDSTNKTQFVNGISMYHQWIWIKGKYIVDELNRIKFI